MSAAGTLEPRAGRGPYGALERQVLARVRGGSIAWRPLRRTVDGHLVLGARIGCGNRHPGHVRDVTVTVAPIGLVHGESCPRPA